MPSHILSSGEEATLYTVDPEREERSDGEGEEKGSRTGGLAMGGRGGRMAAIAAERAVIAVARAVLSTGGGGATTGADVLGIMCLMNCG